MTYSSPLIHTTQQDHGPIYHSKGVAAYYRVDELDEKFDKIHLELKALRGKKLFGKNVYDLFLVPNVMIPPKFKIPDFEKYKGNTGPETHLAMYVRKMFAQVTNDGCRTHMVHESK